MRGLRWVQTKLRTGEAEGEAEQQKGGGAESGGDLDAGVGPSAVLPDATRNVVASSK